MFDISLLNDGDILKLKYSMLDFVNYYNDKESSITFENAIRMILNKDEHDNPNQMY